MFKVDSDVAILKTGEFHCNFNKLFVLHKNFEIQNKCIENFRISAGGHVDSRDLPVK